MLFDKVFKDDYEFMKSHPHKEFSSENHASSACQDLCGFPADQLHCTVPPEAGARGALQIQINAIPSSSINFGRIFHLNRPIHHGNSETGSPSCDCVKLMIENTLKNIAQGKHV